MKSDALPRYGSKHWANEILHLGCEEIKNTDRDRGARLQLIAYYLRILHDEGFWWQYGRLRNQVHLGYKNGVFTVSKETDSQSQKTEEVSH